MFFYTICIYNAQLSTAVAWREKKSKRFVFNKYFCLVLGVLKSKISKKFGEGFLRKLDFKLFYYKGSFKNYVDRMRCVGGPKMLLFVYV